MIAARCLLFVVRGLLMFVVCRGLELAANCYLLVAEMNVVSGSLFVVVCCLLFVACCDLVVA